MLLVFKWLTNIDVEWAVKYTEPRIIGLFRFCGLFIVRVIVLDQLHILYYLFKSTWLQGNSTIATTLYC